MKHVMRRFVGLALLGAILLAGARVGLGQVAGRYQTPVEGKPGHVQWINFSGNTLQDAFDDMYKKRKLHLVSRIEVQTGRIRTDDWLWLRNRNGAKGRVLNLFEFTVLPTVTDVQNMPDPLVTNKSEGRLGSNYLSICKVSKLKYVSRFAFYGGLSALDFPDMEKCGEEAFAASDRYSLHEAKFLKFKTMGSNAFQGCRNMVRFTAPKLTDLKEQGQHFQGCENFSLLELGTTVPDGAREAIFEGCPPSRYLRIVDEQGQPLQGGPLMNAAAKYKNDTKNFKDGKWCGWYVIGLQGNEAKDAKIHPIRFAAIQHTANFPSFSVPTHMAMAGEQVQLVVEPDWTWRIKRLWIEYTEGGVKKEMDVDPANQVFTMPDAEVLVRADIELNRLKIRVNGTIELEGYSIDGIVSAYTKSHPGETTLWELAERVEVIEGEFRPMDWRYIVLFRNMTDFTIHKGVKCFMPRLIGWTWFSNEWRKLSRYLLWGVEKVPPRFFRGAYRATSILLPSAKRLGEQSLLGVYHADAFSVLGLPAKAVPEANINVFKDPKQRVIDNKPRFLAFLGEDGIPLKRGAEREQAKALYKADKGYDNTTNKWYNLSLDAYVATVGSSPHGTIEIIDPPLGVCDKGYTVKVKVTPHPGYSFKEGSLKFKKDTQAGSAQNIQDMKFEMPDDDVTITGEFEPEKLKVVCAPEGQGTLTATPKENVEAGTQVQLVVAPMSGYELEPGSLRYQQLDDPTADFVPITDPSNTFQMPAYSVKVFARFVGKVHKITKCSSMTNGDIVTIPASAPFRTGDRIIVNARPQAAPGPGGKPYVLKAGTLKWNGTAIADGGTFVMPDADVELCCEFELTAGLSVTVENLDGGTLTPDKNNNLTAGAEVKVKVAEDCGFTYKAGTLRYRKASEPETAPGTPISTATGVEKEWKFNMPNESVVLTAEFEPTDHTITVKQPANGGTIRVESPGVTNVKTGAVVTLSLAPEIGYVARVLEYVEANKPGAAPVPIDPRVRSFRMPCYDIEIRGAFEASGHSITISNTVEHGTLTVQPRMNNVPADMRVKVVPTPDADYELRPTSLKFRVLPSGSPQSLQKVGTNEYEFTMPDADVELTAEFNSTGNNIIFTIAHGRMTADIVSNVPVGHPVRLSYGVDPMDPHWEVAWNTARYRELPRGAAPGIWHPITNRQFTMPDASVEVTADVTPTGNSVFVMKLEHGEIAADPWANVIANTPITFTVKRADPGYDFDFGSIQYTQRGQSLWRTDDLTPQGDKVILGKMPNYSIDVRGTFRPKKYEVRILEGIEGGNLQPSNIKPFVDEKVTVDYTRKPGYAFVEGSLAYQAEGTSEWVTIDGGAFVMPPANVTLRATFERRDAEMFNVYILVEGDGQLSVMDGGNAIFDGMLVTAGTELTMEPTPGRGARLQGIIATTKNVDTVRESNDKFTWVVKDNTTIKAIFVSDNITSVENAHPVDVHPNPFADVLRVNAAGATRVQLFTVSGQVLLQQPWGDGTVRVGNIPSGVYLLRVQFVDGTTTVRRVVRL